MDAEPVNMIEQDASPLCADVAIDVPAATHGQSVYTYRVPPHLVSRLRPGHLVWIPLRRNVDVGLVTRLHDEPPDIALKTVTSLVKPEFRLDHGQLETARWISRETVTSLYAAASPFFPPGVTHSAIATYELVDGDDPLLAELTPAQQNVTELLKERGQMTSGQIARALGKNLARTLRTLEEQGYIQRTLEHSDRQPVVRTERFARLLRVDMEAVARAARQRSILEIMVQRTRLLGEDNGLFAVNDLLRQSGADGSALKALEKKGLIELVELAESTSMRKLNPAPAPVLTTAQARAWHTIEANIRDRRSTATLLYGVTGSGKTEIYLRMAGRCLREGRSAIVLLPEIALATQIVRRFEERFPGKVAVLHSAQSDSERYGAWKSIASNNKPIVVGPRSALFAPVQDLGCIVLDEEQDPAYKQDSDPRYHARHLAEFFAVQHRAALVLGSATPAVETAFRASQGDLERVGLPERVNFATGGVDTVQDRSAAQLPDVRIVDMRAEARLTGATLISTALLDAVRNSVAQQKQSIVLLNRRGMSTIVMCRSCGHSIDCPQCDIPMVYHRDRDRMICHRCDSRIVPPRGCLQCGGQLDYFGAGTQRIEQELKRHLPDARIMRVDRDSVKQLGGYEKVLSRVERGEADIVVGTQLVAKGLDFPRVSTVGVIQADSMLHMPDYRSAERTYQLIAQVAGRAGRRATRGDVFVQTYTPDHYAVVAAARHSYEDFFGPEIEFREQFRYPPFSRLARFVIRAPTEGQCQEESQVMALELARHARRLGVEADLIGPAPAFVAKIRGVFQWQIVLRAPPANFDAMLDEMPARPGWIVDIDPMSML